MGWGTLALDLNGCVSLERGSLGCIGKNVYGWVLVCRFVVWVGCMGMGCRYGVFDKGVGVSIAKSHNRIIQEILNQKVCQMNSSVKYIKLYIHIHM